MGALRPVARRVQLARLFYASDARGKIETLDLREYGNFIRVLLVTKL